MVTGFIVQQHSGSFRPALLTGAMVGFSSAVIYWLGVRRQITVKEIALDLPTAA